MTTEFVFESSSAAEFPKCASFDEMGLSENLLRGVYSMGFEKPSAIQSVAIMPMTKGRDVLGQAQSGTGKTGTFGIGLLSRIDPEEKGVQAIVIAHVHELAEQNHTVISNLCQFMGNKKTGSKVSVVYAVGGTPRHQNVREIRAGAQILCGTPGRIYDLASSGEFDMKKLRIFVLDEADELLRDRFADQVTEIVKLGLPDTCQIAFFSATIPDEVKELACRILRDPVSITLKTADVKLDAIKQYYVAVDEDSWKVECFSDIFESMIISQSIVFTNTKERAERLCNILTERGFPVSVIYGNPMTEAIRQKRMDDFRHGKTRVLISTNILARGIDVQGIGVVFNFDLTSFEDKENYIHRIGRCARFGRKGVAISFVTPEEKDTLDQIASHYSFAPLPLPQNVKEITTTT
jgi:translation initiation factor 4A